MTDVVCDANIYGMTNKIVMH